MFCEVRTAGDTGLYVTVGDAIDVSINAEVHRVARGIREAGIKGILDVVPGYASVYVECDPVACQIDLVASTIERLDVDALEVGERSVVQIPVCYGGEYGPDCERVAEITGVDFDEIVRLHTEPEYQVYFIGFTPGFAFLGGMHPAIAVPRLESPRPRVPRGSVGIAGSQTGVYPVTSPGGWNLVGRTPEALYDPGREDPIRLRPGDRVRFIAISDEAFVSASDRAGSYGVPW